MSWYTQTETQWASTAIVSIVGVTMILSHFMPTAPTAPEAAAEAPSKYEFHARNLYHLFSYNGTDMSKWSKRDLEACLYTFREMKSISLAEKVDREVYTMSARLAINCSAAARRRGLAGL